MGHLLWQQHTAVVLFSVHLGRRRPGDKSWLPPPRVGITRTPLRAQGIVGAPWVPYMVCLSLAVGVDGALEADQCRAFTER